MVLRCLSSSLLACSEICRKYLKMMGVNKLATERFKKRKKRTGIMSVGNKPRSNGSRTIFRATLGCSPAES